MKIVEHVLNRGKILSKGFCFFYVVVTELNGLFTRSVGKSSARVTLAKGLNIARVCKQNFTGRVTLSTQVNYTTTDEAGESAGKLKSKWRTKKMFFGNVNYPARASCYYYSTFQGSGNK